MDPDAGTTCEGPQHLHFVGADADPLGTTYGASIPIETALAATKVGGMAAVLHARGSAVRQISFWLLLNGSGAACNLACSLHDSLSQDVLLAYEMNGKPLSRDHGAPLRVVVPGTTGARSVKWLAAITASRVESPSHCRCCPAEPRAWQSLNR